MKKFLFFILLSLIGATCVYAEVVSAFSVKSVYLNNGKVKLNNSGVTPIKMDLSFTRYLPPNSQYFETANIYFKLVALNAATGQVIQDLTQLYNITTNDFGANSGLNKTYDVNITYNSTLSGAGQYLRIGLLWKSIGQTPPNGYPNGMWVWSSPYQVQIVTPPVTTPPVNDELNGAVTLNPSSSTSCLQQTSASFNNSTIVQRFYENFGENGVGNSLTYHLGDLWYKFTSTATSHEVLISSPPTGYSYRVELFSMNNSVLRLIDAESSINGSATSLKTSGLTINQLYYVRLILISEIQNKNINLNICISTPIIQSAVLKVKNRYDNSGYIYDGNTIGLSYTIPQNISESDLSFDWRVGGLSYAVDGTFLYPEGSSPVNNGTYSLFNVQGRRVKVGLGPKSPGNETPFWLFWIEVRIRQISTNTYLTDWIRGGGGQSEL